MTPSPKTQRATGLRGLWKRAIVIGFVLVCALVVLVIVMRSRSQEAPIARDGADVTNARLVAEGQRLYATRCAGCHGGDLGGQPGWPQRQPNGVLPASPLDERGLVWQRDDQWIFTTIKSGGQATAAPGTTSSMPAFGNLTDSQVWAVISYIKSTWPEATRNAQPQRPN